MGFLKFLLIALLIYYGLLLAGRWLMPWFLRYMAKRTMTHMEKRFGAATQPEHDEEPGKVSWSTQPKKPKKEKPQVGEYIEFEEIE